MDQEDTSYHVLNRGNERRAIFREEQDREGFLARLGRCAERFGGTGDSQCATKV
jgi:hypothetical protein